MIDGERWCAVFSVLATALLTACGSSPTASTPVSQTHPRTPTTMVFTESASGFSTSDLRDVNEQILQVSILGELIWTADGTHLPGYGVEGHSIDGVTLYWISGTLCPEGCALEVRFGTKDGERRAYLTADYGHENPGTLVDVEVVGGALVVRRTDVFPPGTPTLSGVVFEATPSGRIPVAGAQVLIGISSGWRGAMSDANGFYSIPGVFNVRGPVHASKDGYHTPQDTSVVISGDTVLDIGLVRR